MTSHPEGGRNPGTEDGQQTMGLPFLRGSPHSVEEAEKQGHSGG